MGKAIRKNIYIPEEQIQLYQNGEELAKEKDISMSMLILKGISMFIEANENKSNTITLTIKQYEDNSIIPIMKQIKFVGEKLGESGYIPDNYIARECIEGNCDLGEVVCDLDNYEISDHVAHYYMIYKTQKGKLLVYIDREHTNGYYENGLYEIKKQTFSYKIYNTLEEMVQDIKDIPSNTIEEIVKHDIVEEFLDI